MKIIWLNQLRFDKASGGGERYQQDLFKYIKSLGHEVFIYDPNYYIGKLESDLFILWDVYNRPGQRASNWFKQEDIERIVDNYTYITGDCGYSTICDRDYLPCNLVYKGCADCFCAGPRLKWLQKYYNNAAANIFLSPLHAATIEKAIECELPNKVLLGPTIDTAIFKNLNIERIWDIIHVGVFNEAKGAHLLINQFGDTNKKVLIVGPNLWPYKLPANFTYKGFMSDASELAVLYNQSVSFNSQCAWPEPFGRTSVEAALCGCQILFNENLGSASWGDLDWLNYDFSKSNENCWNEILPKLGDSNA